MAESLLPVAFHGATLLAVLVNGIPHVSIRSICEALGLDVQAQTRRLRRHPVLGPTVAITATPSAGGDQQTITLPLDKLNGWLFGVSAARVRPELRERLVQYQRECFDVLAAHFGATTGAPGALPAPTLSGQWLVGRAADGSEHATRLREGQFVTDWPTIAEDIRNGAFGAEYLPALRSAAALALFNAAAHTPRGHGAQVAKAIREAREQLSMADLHEIAVAATAELWSAAYQAEQGANAKAREVLRALPRPKGRP